MESNRKVYLLLAMLVLVLASVACGIQSRQSDVDEAVRGTLSAMDSAPSGDQEAVVDDDQPDATVEQPATEEPPVEPPTPTATVQHFVIPSSPAGVQSFITDRSTASLAAERRAIADNFDWNLVERPFTAEVMDYKDYLDITRAEISLNPPFMYVTIHLEGAAPADSTAAYGVEVDTDVDGYGDWLILGTIPPDSTWTTDGVRACRDANGDVGGPTPMRTDPPHTSRDGYEDCVFDSGYGVGPDEAWIRRDPSHADRVQIAFMFTLIGSDGQFTWGVWADEGVQEPGWFDYHDHFTLAEAGSPASESSHYPLKAMAAMDNTCRWSYGFDLTGSEIGVCPVPATPTPVPLGSISGRVFRDDNNNGVQDGEFALSGFTVELRSSGCGSVLASTTSGGDGSYSFTGLAQGDYCVQVVVSSSCGGYGHHSSLPNPRNVSLGAGQHRTGVNFGFWPYIC